MHLYTPPVGIFDIPLFMRSYWSVPEDVDHLFFGGGRCCLVGFDSFDDRVIVERRGTHTAHHPVITGGDCKCGGKDTRGQDFLYHSRRRGRGGMSGLLGDGLVNFVLVDKRIIITIHHSKSMEGIAQLHGCRIIPSLNHLIIHQPYVSVFYHKRVIFIYKVLVICRCGSLIVHDNNKITFQRGRLHTRRNA